MWECVGNKGLKASKPLLLFFQKAIWDLPFDFFLVFLLFYNSVVYFGNTYGDLLLHVDVVTL